MATLRSSASSGDSALASLSTFTASYQLSQTMDELHGDLVYAWTALTILFAFLVPKLQNPFADFPNDCLLGQTGFVLNHGFK